MGVSGREQSSPSLDDKLLRFMDQLELLEQKRTSLNSLIEQGWFTMSKARYSMGNKQVSALQYANEMEPLVHVHVRTLDNDEVEFCIERSPQTCGEESVKDLTSVEDIGPREEGVRQRKKTKIISEKKTSEDISEQKAPAWRRDHNPQQDPLKWFGILVPQPLKHAQSSFIQVIELSAEIAALQIAVLNTREELKDGLKNKKAPGEQFRDSADHGSESNTSAGSEQEGTKVPSSTGSQ
uniref:Vacuolar ATPase assembly protein VMA22 n=1 Tax=Nothobranchius kadleci TaxID=1051664 RepID=A0A1A8D1P1_NOTKA